MAVDRATARHALISIAARRQKPGSGSLLDEQMRSRRERMNWWTEALASLGGVTHAVAGAPEAAGGAAPTDRCKHPFYSPFLR